jgi:hypothetical protein
MDSNQVPCTFDSASAAIAEATNSAIGLKEVVIILILIFLCVALLYLLYKTYRQDQQIEQLGRGLNQNIMQDQDVIEILTHFFSQPSNRRLLQRWIDPAVGPMVQHYVGLYGQPSEPQSSDRQTNEDSGDEEDSGNDNDNDGNVRRRNPVPLTPSRSFANTNNLDEPPPLEDDDAGRRYDNSGLPGSNSASRQPSNPLVSGIGQIFQNMGGMEGLTTLLGNMGGGGGGGGGGSGGNLAEGLPALLGQLFQQPGGGNGATVVLSSSRGQRQ